MRRRDLLLTAPALALGAAAFRSLAQPPSAALAAAVAAPERAANNRARDVYRHPAATLAFWGLEAAMTVVEIEPAGGYWTEILAPYLAAGGGRYIAAIGGDPGPFQARFGDRPGYGAITVVKLFEGPLAPAGSADLVITARNIHDWLTPPGRLETALGEFNAALRGDGLLGVEEHRADPRAMLPGATDGYVSTRWLADRVEAAGFALAAASEINANPKDLKAYPFGVWTLPPALRSHAKGQPTAPDYDPARYLSIGESDRMTLRFRKTREV